MQFYLKHPSHLRRFDDFLNTKKNSHDQCGVVISVDSIDICTLFNQQLHQTFGTCNTRKVFVLITFDFKVPCRNLNLLEINLKYICQRKDFFGRSQKEKARSQTFSDGQHQCRIPVLVESIDVNAIREQPLNFIPIPCNIQW